jgi:hypothetical protein
VGSVWTLDVAATATADLEQVRRIIGVLGETRHVWGEAGSTWKVDYLDFEDRDAALNALEADLGGIDARWGEALLIG